VQALTAASCWTHCDSGHGLRLEQVCDVRFSSLPEQQQAQLGQALRDHLSACGTTPLLTDSQVALLALTTFAHLSRFSKLAGAVRQHHSAAGPASA
jgi:hypothetical protein